jgi:hypothetical protein
VFHVRAWIGGVAALSLSAGCGALLGSDDDEPIAPAADASDEPAVTPDDASPDVVPRPAANVVFVTTGDFTGNLGGIDGANALCNVEARANGLLGTYVAWLKAANGDRPADRVADASFMLVDTVVVFPAKPGNPTMPISKTADGGIVDASARAWTGVQMFGPSDLCGNGVGGDPTMTWRSASNGLSAATGNPHTAGANWQLGGSASCNQRRHLYCFQQ